MGLTSTLSERKISRLLSSKNTSGASDFSTGDSSAMALIASTHRGMLNLSLSPPRVPGLLLSLGGATATARAASTASEAPSSPGLPEKRHTSPRGSSAGLLAAESCQEDGSGRTWVSGFGYRCPFIVWTSTPTRVSCWNDDSLDTGDGESCRFMYKSSSSSSSSSASQSFTQWRLPVHHPPQASGTGGDALLSAEEKFATGEVVAALRAVEREMEAAARPVPAGVVAGVVAAVREPLTAPARLAAKALLAVLLEEGNREAAVEAGAASAAVEAVAASGPAGATAERALAALELLCTAPGGAPAVRREALAAPVLARAVEGMAGRGRECAIGVLAAIYGAGGEDDRGASSSPPPPPEVVKAVVAAMQGECSARGRRKGAQLLRALQEGGRLGLAWDGIGDQ